MKQAIFIMGFSLFCLGQAFAVGKTLPAHTSIRQGGIVQS